MPNTMCIYRGHLFPSSKSVAVQEKGARQDAGDFPQVVCSMPVCYGCMLSSDVKGCIAKVKVRE